MNMVSPNTVSLDSRWRPSPYRPPAQALRPQGTFGLAAKRIGEGPITTNPLDSRVISFVANGGGSIVSFMAMRVFQPGFWRYVAFGTGLLTGLRAMNDFFQMTGVGVVKSAGS